MKKLLIFSIIIGLFSCHTKKIAENQNTKNYTVEFGEFGGITGGATRFILNEFGVLNKTESMSGDIYSDKAIDSEEYKKLCVEIEECEKLESSVQYGNMNCYIKILKNKELRKQFQWSKESTLVNVKIKELHVHLMQLDK